MLEILQLIWECITTVIGAFIIWVTYSIVDVFIRLTKRSEKNKKRRG